MSEPQAIPPKLYQAYSVPEIGDLSMRLVTLLSKLTALADYWDNYPDRQVCAGDLRAVISGLYDPTRQAP